MTRYLELQLAEKDETLKVARWGIVPLVLGERTVTEWSRDLFARRRDVRWDGEEREIRGHEGFRAWGEKRRLAGSLRTGLARAVGRSPVVNFEARIWHCPESNRLFLVEGLYGKDSEALQGAAESIVCHEEQ
jgi:hypothetical protein